MFTVRTSRPDELRAIVRLVLSQPELSPRDLERNVDAFLAYAERERLRPERQFVIEGQGRLLAGCLCVDAPGRTSIVFPPSVRAQGAMRPWLIQMLTELRRRSAEAGVQLLQCLLWPPDREEDGLLRDAGFDYLAELIYLDRQLLSGTRRRSSRAAEASPFTWQTYEPRTHAIFVETIRATYEASLDCPKLNGLREMDDVLEGHKATGVFDGSDWFVASHPMQPDRPAGVLLLSRILRAGDGQAMEVVYMGVVPWARRQGVGSRLIQQALERARERKATHLTLAVDANNRPARDLYERFGFFETARRRAWICSP